MSCLRNCEVSNFAL